MPPPHLDLFLFLFLCRVLPLSFLLASQKSTLHQAGEERSVWSLITAQCVERESGRPGAPATDKLHPQLRRGILQDSRPRPQRRRLQSPWHVIHLLLPWLLDHWLWALCAVMEGRRQLHGYRQSLLSLPRPELAFSAPLWWCVKGVEKEEGVAEEGPLHR